MPMYEFHCIKCNHNQDHILKRDDPKPVCPVCKADKEYQKQVSSASFQLKGTGWYQTDFKYNDK